MDITGITIPGRIEDNLCWKAYSLLQLYFKIPPVHIHLHKLLPTGAGLGGGSADAAFALRSLDELFQLHLSPTQLSQYASLLGSDCAFFTQDRAMIGTGRGELLQPATISLDGKFIVVVKPDIHISTAEAYSQIVPKKSSPSVREIVETRPLTEWKDLLLNDFEESAFKRHPSLNVYKKLFYDNGALYASMSGSGSSVFGIFNHPVELKSKFQGLTYWSGGL